MLPKRGRTRDRFEDEFMYERRADEDWAAEPVLYGSGVDREEGGGAREDGGAVPETRARDACRFSTMASFPTRAGS